MRKVLRAVPIRWRLAAAFAVAMAGLLVALGAFVYLRVNEALRHSVDQALRAQALESARHVGRGRFVDADARESGIVVELLDGKGRVVRSDPAALPTLVDSEIRAVAAHRTVLTTVSRGNGELNHWRALATSVDGDVLVVARSLRPTEETLRHVFRGLVVAGPVGLLLATLGGYLLAAAALRPVESMRQRASAISAKTAHARLPVPPSRDEIRELAETLNDMLERLEAALDHERRFVADASHELRTPLALLKTELELALRRPRSQDELRAAVASAAEETDRLVRLAEDLLLIARSDQTDLPLRLEELDLAEVLSALAGRFAERAANAARRIVLELSPEACVRADPSRIEEAVGNLLDNALTHGAGTITVRTRPRDATIEIHVLDEGDGFGPELAQRAFDRFSRGDDARSRGGSGLGLAIVLAIAQAHGGTASVGRARGGADVWISLPAGGPSGS